MSKCFYHSEYCAGEILSYEFPIGKEEEEKKLKIMGCFPLCETHKRGKLYVQKSMRPSIPYQGMARRAEFMKQDVAKIEIVHKNSKRQIDLQDIRAPRNFTKMAAEINNMIDDGRITESDFAELIKAGLNIEAIELWKKLYK